jgi:hypothetical protein
LVFQENPEVPGRDWCPSSSEGVVGFDSANDVDGREFLRLGWISCSQLDDRRRAPE